MCCSRSPSPHHIGRNPVGVSSQPVTPVEARLTPSCSLHAGRSPAGTRCILTAPVEARLVPYRVSATPVEARLALVQGRVSTQVEDSPPFCFYLPAGLRSQGSAHPGHKRLPATCWSAERPGAVERKVRVTEAYTSPRWLHPPAAVS
jgi:hypothetical protein